MKNATSRSATIAAAIFALFGAATIFAQDKSTEPSTPVQASAPDAKSDELKELEAKADPKALKAIELYLDGDVAGAYRAFKEVYDANPDSDPPGVLLALLHSHAGRLLEMRRALEQTAEDYPSDPEAYLQLAGVDAQEGRFLESQLLIERAEKLIDNYKETHPETTTRFAYLKEEALSARANLAERQERYEEARSIVKKIIETNPNNAQAQWNLGYLSMKLRDYEGAEAAFDEAAKHDPELWPGWLQVASSLDREDLVQEGIALMDKRQEQLKDAPASQLAQVARLYLRWNKIEEATKIVEKLVLLGDDNNVERWLLSGWLNLYANQYAAAEADFQRATIVAPENFEASNGLALALLDQSNKEKLARAKTIAAKNYYANPESTDAAVTYAWTLFLSGNQKESNEIFGPMLSSGKMTATVAYYLAEIANFRGDVDLAKTLLELSISQKANFPKRTAALELQELLNETTKVDPMSDFDEEPDFGDDKTPNPEQKESQTDSKKEE